LRRALAELFFGIRWVLWQARRPLQRLRRPPTWVLFLVEEAYPEVPPPPRPRWQRLTGRAPMSLADLREHFHRIAADPRVEGVILHLRQLGITQAQVQAFRELILELRHAGKRVVSYASSYTTATYHVACACDEVLLMPGGSVNATGYARTYMFLADALERVGLRADIIQVSPYKTAGDVLSRSAMSEEARQMANWLADAAFDELVADAGTGRSLEPGQARALIDAAPMHEEAALAQKAVDAVLFEEELGPRLGGQIMDWRQARRRLARPAPQRPGRYIALLRIEGTILDGRSSRPPLGPRLPLPLLLQARTGDLTVVAQARRLAEDPRVAAVLLWVDSGGGSSTASEAMSSALAALANTKPLVALMGSVAASGGYHVVTSAQRVFAQPGTLTGSIGVLAGKVTAGGLFDRALVHRERVSRGEHADIFGLDTPFTDEERERVRALVEHTYLQFVDRVARSRGMTREEVDAVAGGRVWTGRQALERGLVDELGGLAAALAHLRTLAGLPEWARLREIRGEPVAGPPSGAASPTGGSSIGVGVGAASALAYALESAALLSRAVTWLLSPLLDPDR
jgi:protease-4